MTAVEWLIKQVGLDHHTGAWKKEIEQAIEIEKQQIIEAYDAGYKDGNSLLGYEYFDDSKSYYEKTYKPSA